jgi:hypothetical protein
MGERGENGPTSLEDSTRGGDEHNSIWSNEPESLSLEAAPSAPTVYFETSDLSEACTDGVWLFPTAFRNHTILVFDLQGSDKGSDAEVRAADQLIVSLVVNVLLGCTMHKSFLIVVCVARCSTRTPVCQFCPRSSRARMLALFLSTPAAPDTTSARVSVSR